MDPKAFVIAVFSVVIVACVLQAIYSEKLGAMAVRSIAASPRPVRLFYDWTSFGQPYDGPFWNRTRRILSLAVGAVFLVSLLVVLVRG
jgi:hypothetical protein